MGFFSALQLAFIILKLTKFINWSWWLVLLPINIVILLMIILFLITTFLKQ